MAFTSSSQLLEDTDDDNDGWDDVDEVTCGTDPLDSNDFPLTAMGMAFVMRPREMTLMATGYRMTTTRMMTTMVTTTSMTHFL